jgi:putative tryptophan/tyrosine transport system substrate-binding protein
MVAASDVPGRRQLLAALGTLLVGEPGRAQGSGKLARVGFLSPLTVAQGEPYLRALLTGLQALGWSQGGNLLVDARFADAVDAEVPRLARDLVRLRPDMIVCGGPVTALALKKLDAKIPVVFVFVANPVALGLVGELARPGGNFTGLASMDSGSLAAKQIQLLREVVPRASRMAVLLNPANPNHASGREPLRRGLNELGLKAIEIEATTRDDLEAGFAEAGRQRADCMWAGGDALFLAHAELIAALALKHRIPTMFLQKQLVKAGALMSYGSDPVGMYRRAATYVDKILKGTAPADLPVQAPTEYELVINMKTAQALGLRIPQSVLLGTTELIE